MWSNFYAAGGWAMHPVSVFGFLLIAASVLSVQRRDSKYQRLAVVLGVVTLSAGLLGTASGICASAHYLDQVPAARQLEIFALGIEESMHDVILALVLVVVAGLVAAVGALRGPAASGAPALG
jgi:hypothetical protein